MKIVVTTEEQLQQIVQEAVAKAISNQSIHTKEEDGELISRKRVCELLCISLPTLYRWRRKGFLPAAIYLGNKVLFKKIEILKIIEDGGIEM